MSDVVTTVVAPEATEAPIENTLPVSDAAVEAAPAPESEPAPAQSQDPYETRFKKAAEAAKQARQERAALAEQKRELREYEEWQRVRNLSPAEKAKFVGLTYDGWTQELVKGGKIGVEAQVDEVGQELRALKEQLSQREAELARQQEQQLISTYEQDLHSHAKSNPEYDFVSRIGNPAELRQIAEEHWHATGELPSHDEVCALYEQRLEAEYARKLVDSPKLRKLLSAQVNAAPPRATSAPKTINNNLSASATAVSDIDNLPFEEKKRLITRSLRASVE